MKFKEGDLVRIKRYCSGCEAGRVYPLHFADRYGELHDNLWAWDGTVEGCGCDCENNWELMKHGGNLAKPKPVLYAVFYEENGVDPLKEFYSRKELNDWLKEASEDRGIRWDSIRVIERPKFLKVEVSKSFRLKA
jgi:hypothetical protein